MRAILCLTSLGFVGLPTVLGSSAKDTPYQQPEQIHIALGQPGEVTVHWSSIQESYLRQKSGYHPGESYVIYGESIDDLTRTVIGSSFLFQDYGPERRKFTMHMAAMKGLTANTKYCYMVGGNRTGWSAPMYFTSPPVTDHDVKVRLPMTYAIYGDQGDYNAQTLPSLQQAAARGELDMVLHVGDMAYDFHSDNGRNGDAWMRDIEPLAAYVPYMVSHGNHESAQNFNHYTQRFRNMPSNSGTLTFPEFGTVPNNWWYSWDDGLVHFVAISTEVYFDYHDMVPEQYRWLEKDLAAVNRSKTPWVVVHGHRPLYCSCDEDCDAPATTNRMGLQLPDGTFKYGLEQLFYQHGVDFYIAGHEHDYERMYDVAPGYDAATPWLSGATTRSTVDPPATTYIVTGSAGNIEDHESFSRPAPSRSAKRLNTYGWSKMTVYNASHILWQQIQTDTAAPSSTWGQVMDEAWIVQQHHGPFADHPRRSEIEKVGLAGLPALADPEVSLDVAMKYAARRLKNEAQCKHMPAGQEPRCTDPRLAQDLAQQGRWQYTKRRADGDGVQLV